MPQDGVWNQVARVGNNLVAVRDFEMGTLIKIVYELG
jgi:hypothetical protein